MEFKTQINQEEIDKIAKEAATKAISDELNKYFNNYDSPFRKKLREALEAKELPFSFQLPDIIAVINDKIAQEIDIIANKALAETYIPWVRKTLTRAEPTVMFSDILYIFVKELSIDKRGECEVEVDYNNRFGWYIVKLTHGDIEYELTLHSKDKDKNSFQLLSLPNQGYDRFNGKTEATIQLQDGILKVPFSRNILNDNFIGYVASLVIAKSEIIMDSTDFYDEWFSGCRC